MAVPATKPILAARQGSAHQFILATLPLLGVLVYFLYQAARRPYLPIYQWSWSVPIPEMTLDHMGALAANWLTGDCDTCGDIDLSGDGSVNLDDLKLLSNHWLTTPPPITEQ